MTNTINRLDTPIALLEDQLDYSGYAIIEGLLSKEYVRTLRNELDSFLCRTPRGEGDFVGRRTRRMGSIFRKSESSHALAEHPLVLRLMDHLLLSNCSRYQINLTQAICIDPGEIAQPLHRDDGLFPHRSKPGELMANAMWALTDFTEENGATRIVPQSHIWADQPTTNAPSMPMEMAAGSLLVYRGSLFHGGGENRSQQSRFGLVISYCLGWLRQAENQYLAHPPDFAMTLPESLQSLLGYSIHEPQLGSFEGQDPSIALSLGSKDVFAFRDYFPSEAQEMIAAYAENERAVQSQRHHTG